MRVSKRAGGLEHFKENKIRKALYAAFSSVNTSVPDLAPITRNVINKIAVCDGEIIRVETLQDVIERVLMESGYHEVARAFIIYREERSRLREQRLTPDPAALRDYICVSKYARHLEEHKRRETWYESCERVRDMHLRRFSDLPDEYITQINEVFEDVKEQRNLGSMRMMQFGGAAVEQINARGYNCCYTLVDRPKVFQGIMHLLLAGCGVGYSVQIQHVEMLPRLAKMDRHNVRHYVVPDTIEGWSDCVGELIRAAIEGYWLEPAYCEIRDEGVLLKTSGGRAPGHLGLRDAIEAVRSILLKAQGRRLRPIECHDIICHLALAVVSGGIRRASLMCIFSKNDSEMMYCKAHENFDPRVGGKNSHRAMANNAVALLRSEATFEDLRRIMEINKEWGDPGFFFTDNLDWGCNPCAEIGLDPVWIDPVHGTRETGFAFCNLCEVNVAKCVSVKEYLEACRKAAILGTLQASYTDFGYLGDVSEKIAARDALLGVSMMGMADNPDLAFDPEVQRLGAEVVNKTNAVWAELIGINPAKRTTTIKPGGTGPLAVGGIASGIGEHHARRYFRRVKAVATEWAFKVMQKHNPHMLEDHGDGSYTIVFPCEAPEGAVTVKNGGGALDFMDRIFLTYDNWVRMGKVDPNGPDHNISATVTVKDSERNQVVQKVWENRHRITAMSFAPYFLDKLHKYAPREECVGPEDEARWNAIIRNYKPIDWSLEHEELDGTSHTLTAACVGGACDV
jgi:ribonucleoside-diphosphate reductase alpha chain